LICSFLSCLSWLLRSRVRKSRRDLWITLYIPVYFSKLSIGHDVQGHMLFRSIN